MKYEATLNDGRIVELESDKQPTESEILSAVADFEKPKSTLKEKVFTPISEQLTGRTLGERTRIPERVQPGITEAISKTPGLGTLGGPVGNLLRTATAYHAQLPGAIAQKAVELADVSPFDVGLMAATMGLAKIPIGGTTLGQIASRVPVGKGFVKGAKELGRLQETLKPFRGQFGAPKLRAKTVAAQKTIQEVTSDPKIFNSQGVEVTPSRNKLVPSYQRTVPKQIKQIVEQFDRQQTEILAADRGIIPIKKQIDMAPKITQELYDTWKPGQAVNTETQWAMTKDFLEQLGKLGEKPTADMVKQLSSNVIKADAMLSESARAVGARSKIQTLAKDQLQYVAQQIKKLDPEAQGAASKLLKQFKTPGFWDKFMEYRTASLLTSPYTHERNIVGNIIGRIFNAPEKTIAGGINAIESFVTRKPRSVYMREGVADIVGMFRGFGPALRNGLKGLLDENYISDSRILEAVRFNKAIPGLKGKIIRAPFRALNAMDEFFSTLSETASLHSQATRQAIKEGAKSISRRVADILSNPANIPPEMYAQAAQDALKQTFRNKMGPTGQAFQQFLVKSKGGKIIMPFFKTPVNLFKWTYQRALGFASPANWAAIAKGTPEQRADAVAKITLGQIINAGIAMKVFEGKITGRLSSNPNKRAALLRQGIQPYSVKVGDKYVSYRSLEPISMWVAGIANTVELSQEKNLPIDTNKATEILKETMIMMKDQSYLQGISDLTKAIDDPDRYGSQWIQNITSSAIPTGIGYIARLYDPVVKDPDSVPTAILSKLPGFSKKVPPKLDVWGREISREGTLMQRALLPTGVMTTKPDLTEEELMSFEKFPKKITKTYKGLPLTVKERNLITEVEGSIEKEILDTFIQTPKYKEASALEKDKLIDKVFSEVRKAVRTPFFENKTLDTLQKLDDEDKIKTFIKKVARKEYLKTFGGLK